MAEVAPEIREKTRRSRQAAEEPPYRVIIHNDDVTPMEVVIRVLVQIFYLSGPRAVQVMYTAHYHGSAHVQTLPKSEAEKRVHRAHFASRLEGYPLSFTLERE